MKNVPAWLTRYAIFLILIAIAAVMYNPVTGEIGFYRKAATALMSGGMAAGLSLLWAFLIRRGHGWAFTAALATTLLLAGVFSWRSMASWSAVNAGQSEKVYAASLITLMLMGSLAMLGVLFKNSVAPASAEPMERLKLDD